jgi:hypothetical protein
MALRLQMSSQSPIRAVLRAVAFAAVSSSMRARARSSGQSRRRLFRDFNDLDTVVVPTVGRVETVIVRYVRVVKPRAVAGFPRQRADHAELSIASTLKCQ